MCGYFQLQRKVAREGWSYLILWWYLEVGRSLRALLQRSLRHRKEKKMNWERSWVRVQTKGKAKEIKEIKREEKDQLHAILISDYAPNSSFSFFLVAHSYRLCTILSTSNRDWAQSPASDQNSTTTTGFISMPMLSFSVNVAKGKIMNSSLSWKKFLYHNKKKYY